MKIGFLACYPECEHENTKYIKFSDSNTILECDMVIIELEWLFSFPNPPFKHEKIPYQRVI